MKVKLYYLLIPLLGAAQCSWAQSVHWEKVESGQKSDSPAQTQFQEMLQDKDYSLGSEKLPSPRFGAASWQTGDGEWVVFSGLGFDPDGNMGLLDDTWKYSASENSWTLLAGQRKVDSKNWTDQSDLPIPRRNAVSWADNQGNLYLMGGTQLNDSEYFYDLWKYSIKGGGWTRVSEKTTANTSAVWGQQKGDSGGNPGSRSGSISWTDKNGNLWLFGGMNMDASGGQQDLYNDLWMYSVKQNVWIWVSGSDKPNEMGKFSKKADQTTDLTPAARTNAAAWYDDKADKLWLYGGTGIDTTGKDTGGLGDLWSYDIGKNVWQWVGGSTGLFSKHLASNQTFPGYRSSAATWKDQDGNFLLYGGQSKISATEIDINPTIWKFNPGTEKWSPLLASSAPGIMSDAKAFTDAAGNLLLFGGRKFNPATLRANPTNEIWTIKTK